jgi:predicted enzyme related to lactoylglutathione lyase
MTTNPSQFIWYELMTTDLDAALAFYSGVVGWTASDSGLGDRRYAILNMGERGVGGAMALPPPALDGGARPGWIGYIDVDDVDAFVGRVTAQGGAVRRAAEDIPGIGRFAMVADPQGAAFVMMKPIPPAGGVPPPPAPGTPGFAGWHELHAGDGESAFAFYAGLFGWTKGEAMDMGPGGK